MKLYEITNEYENIFNQINEDGEIGEDLLSKIDSVTLDFQEKAISVACYIKNLEAEEKAISDAMKDMAKRKDVLTKQAQYLSDYLQYNLQKLSINEIKSSPYFKIRIKQCPPSVEVVDESQIPKEYFREKVTFSVDKIRLKEVLSEGVEVTGATLQRKLKLEIK